MIDFACREFNLDEIIKCGFGITKAEYYMLNYFSKNHESWLTTEDLAKDLKLNLSTVQRGVKKLFDKQILNRSQNNLSGGGYTFVYKLKPKSEVRKLVLFIIHGWVKRVETEINNGEFLLRSS